MLQPAITFGNLPPDFDRFIQGLVSRYHPQKVVLFGSYARKEQHAASDVDLLVVLSHDGKNPYIAADIHTELRPTFAMDLLVRKPEDIAQRLTIGDRFITEIMNQGVVVYEGDSR